MATKYAKGSIFVGSEEETLAAFRQLLFKKESMDRLCLKSLYSIFIFDTQSRWALFLIVRLIIFLSILLYSLSFLVTHINLTHTDQLSTFIL